MTSRSLARALALSFTVAAFGWAFVGGCGGHPLATPHPSGSAGKGTAGSSSTGAAGASPTGAGPGTAGGATSGEAGSTGAGFGGASGFATGSAGAIAGQAGMGGAAPESGCVEAQRAYDDLKANLLMTAFSSFSCASNADCAAVAEPSNCGSICPDVALPLYVQEKFIASLMSAGTLCNSVCLPRPAVSCPADPAFCVNGRCALAGITGAAGASGGAGQGGGGGASGCGPCMAPQCNPGYTSVVDPAISCCPICRPVDCATAACPQPICPVGTHAEVPQSQCCPVCVMGFSQACNTAQTSYSRDRQAYLEKYGSTSCKQDADCTLVFESNACVANCGEALPAASAGFFQSNIAPDAMACDASCPPLALPPCVPQVAVCSNGRCATVPKGGLGLN
ncbi:MAG TPA: hypothetical protein VHL80_21640 [Polyangia bacterium]|nr:hypothetical protein [Polyangia bacterium]